MKAEYPVVAELLGVKVGDAILKQHLTRTDNNQSVNSRRV